MAPRPFCAHWTERREKGPRSGRTRDLAPQTFLAFPIREDQTIDCKLNCYRFAHSFCTSRPERSPLDSKREDLRPDIESLEIGSQVLGLAPGGECVKRRKIAPLSCKMNGFACPAAGDECVSCRRIAPLSCKINGFACPAAGDECVSCRNRPPATSVSVSGKGPTPRASLYL